MKILYATTLFSLLLIFSCNSLKEEIPLPIAGSEESEMFSPLAPEETDGTTAQIERNFPCRMRGVMFPAPDGWDCRILIETETGHLLYPVNIEEYLSADLEEPVAIKLSFRVVQNPDDRCGRALPVELICLTRDIRRTQTLPGRVE
ncbi:MAG: hypothetical protein SF052_07195 [Bacteroidia bacterium]|nr:hypothetical protein [Bacteroidia bacterium]